MIVKSEVIPAGKIDDSEQGNSRSELNPRNGFRTDSTAGPVPLYRTSFTQPPDPVGIGSGHAAC